MYLVYFQQSIELEMFKIQKNSIRYRSCSRNNGKIATFSFDFTDKNLIYSKKFLNLFFFKWVIYKLVLSIQIVLKLLNLKIELETRLLVFYHFFMLTSCFLISIVQTKSLNFI